jgi:hypothetical protein
MNKLFETIAQKPWILIWIGFFILISVWTIFMVLALRNQPERLPLTDAPAQETSRLETAGKLPLQPNA